MARLLTATLLLLTGVGCDKPAQTGVLPLDLAKANVASQTPLPPMVPADLNAELQENQSLVFQSWAGLRQGSDMDTYVTLHRDKRVDVEYAGYGLESVSGNWKSSDAGIEISAPLSNLVEMPGAADWPPMHLKRGDGKLYLFPARDTDALRYASESAWPLRQIDVAGRKAVQSGSDEPRDATERRKTFRDDC